MKIFVTGGTGAIGQHAVRALVTAGHAVSALSRTAFKSNQLIALGATPIEVSLFDEAKLSRSFAGHDVVVNLATAIPPTAKFMNSHAWVANERIRSQGSRIVVDAAKDAGVARVIQESVSMIYRDRREQWIDEDWSTDRFPMAQGNLAAEASANRFTVEGGIGVVLRFGWFYGPGATHSEEFFALARRFRIAVMLGAANTYLSSIHVEDGGSAVVAALNVPSGTYNVVDDEPVTKSTYADALAAGARRKPWLKAPGRLAHVLGDRTTSLTRSLRVSNQRFTDASTWRPKYPSAFEGWLATADVLLKKS
jgi:nucleoside-diphosphate-sugar epimerase